MQPTLSATDFLKIGGTTAQHFGFEHIDALRALPACKNCTERVPFKTTAQERRHDALHGMLTAGLVNYYEGKLNGIEGPVLFYTTDTVPRTGETAISLQILGVEKSIAEAILIHTLRALLSDLNFPNHTIRINTLGDSESSARYIRELTNYFRKRMGDMPVAARELMKEHVFDALHHLIEKEHELGLRSPSPMEYLSDQSRRHFREIVEYLDMTDTPYEIDPKLLGHEQCYSEALFAVDLLDSDNQPLPTEPLLVRGGRYSAFANHTSKTPIAATGAVVVLRDRKAPARMPRPQKGAVPSIFVVQLGFGPKVKSLLLLQELRRAGIPVMQDIVSDSLSAQLRKAEAQNVQYAIILGQKEFVEGSVILRNLHAQSQECIPATNLVSHLKRIVR